jgi:hypothetical protein
VQAGTIIGCPITVNHQFSTIFHNWTLGVPLEMTDACDYVGGDFYGGPAQHSLACKVYDGLSRHKPFEFHTSRTRLYSDHVTVKPLEEIRTEAFVATLHHAALMLVDYINADGTLNPEVYAFLGELSRQRTAFEPYLGGEQNVTLPFVEPELGTTIGSHFAAIHSNPPALKPESNPAVVLNQYGQGQAAWVAAPVESANEAVNHNLLLALLRSICPGPYCLEVDAHPAVEATLFYQPAQRRYMVGLLNLQQQLPQVPVGATVRLRLEAGQSVRRVIGLPEQAEIDWRVDGRQAVFEVAPFDTFAMVAVEIS